MGKADAVTLHYVKAPERFAQLWNNHVFGGNPVIRPENLRELDTAELMISGRSEREIEFLKKYRDSLKVYNEQAILMILGIENQEEIHYAMPLRQMIYDVMQYEKQRAELEREHRKARDLTGSEFLSGMSKTDRLMPVLTMTVYWGDKTWDGPKNLRDMLDIPLILDQYNVINDYRMNLLEVNSMENLEQYSGELKALLGFVRYQKDKEALKSFVAENAATFSELSLETARAITVLGNAKELNKVLKDKKEDREERVDMCQALQDMMKEERMAGRMEGHMEGRIEGRIEEFLDNCQEFGVVKEAAVDRMVEKFHTTREEAGEYLKKYWRS